MSAFLDRFRPDPELPEIRRVWRTAKPLLRDAVVSYAPFDPDYPEEKVSKSRGPTNDPSCPSARDAGPEVDVLLYARPDSAGRPQERAWDFLTAHPGEVEAALRRKLFALHRGYLRQLLEDELPTAKFLQRYWKTIEPELTWDDPSAVDRLFKLVAIGLAEDGLDDCGFSSYEFQTGWDRDHGVGVLMHRDRVLAAGGMSELIGDGYDLAPGIRCVQGYALHDGDFPLPG